MKKIFALCAAGFMVISMLMLAGCGRSNEEIYNDCAPLVEQIYKDNGIEGVKCTEIIDIREDGYDRYTAVACVKRGSEEKMVDIEISYDSDNNYVIVKIVE